MTASRTLVLTEQLIALASITPQDSYSLCLFDPGWH